MTSSPGENSEGKENQNDDQGYGYTDNNPSWKHGYRWRTLGLRCSSSLYGITKATILCLRARLSSYSSGRDVHRTGWYLHGFSCACRRRGMLHLAGSGEGSRRRCRMPACAPLPRKGRRQVPLDRAVRGRTRFWRGALDGTIAFLCAGARLVAAISPQLVSSLSGARERRGGK